MKEGMMNLMGNGYLISHVLLWTFALLQMAFLLYLTRLIVQFLNRFRFSDKQNNTPSLQTGQKAPDFREKDQHGNFLRPISDKWQNSLLLFVQDSCSKCNEIISQLSSLQKKLPHIRIMVISGKIYYEQGISVPEGVHLIRSDALFIEYHVRVVPTVFLLDAHGNIVDVQEVSTYASLVTMLEEDMNQVS
ncbi:peroxiredoxin family protein [Brevibacillus ruminantium]|uniref:Peroxiredoxin family protein n=1 Tax=Brevibacillus ruminantium TaxID=2950604 RepID=A0ABY4WJJ7_9BACL|nr:conjugal transfer protein TraF [Brevibacillus ruminantium]USG67272.1 peroxiredoxin family protein [Brevibacillus ruminantium]